jgi:hypothetical protein
METVLKPMKTGVTKVLKDECIVDVIPIKNRDNKIARLISPELVL